jgi:hypothetical protein
VTSLAEIQLRMRNAVVTGDSEDIVPMLVGGQEVEKRLAVHGRHYQTSLVTALLGKFPATAWLAGTAFVAQAARRFVGNHPPHAPCIAEYGKEFPSFLSTCAAAERRPYLSEFAELEWHVGHVAVAVDGPALSPEDFSSIEVGALPAALLVLRPGMRYVRSSWPIDELLKLYLTENAPDRYEFEPAEVWIEVRGARGEFHLDRLDAGTYMFRKSISEGQPLGDAAERALDASPAFDPGQALAALIGAGLVTRIKQKENIHEH